MPLDGVPAATAVRTTCPYCGVGCGVLATPRGRESADIAGDPNHPANFGRLCSKGSALGETLSLGDRLLSPSIDGDVVSWDTALDHVAQRFATTIAEHGIDSVGFYVSGQLLTEDYYVANKLMKGFIGSANIDTNSRLCMASSVAGHKRAFGSDTVPGTYEDLELADLVVFVGSNFAWCHPVLFQRLLAAREKRGTKIIAIDPRGTATTQAADLHLAIAPGADVALFNGLFSEISRRQAVDRSYVALHTNGFDAAVSAADDDYGADVAKLTGLTPDDLQRFYDLFVGTERVVTIYSQGVNQSTVGTDKVNAIINCHLATGRIGRPGMGPFSITGQPNAMGGREVGGMANMLACHMELGDLNHSRIVQSFWNSPVIASKPGLKAVDMFRAVHDGRIKALWIMATNPVDSMPDANFVRAAIDGCPFVVVSDVTRNTDTTALADVLLPSLAWGEKDGTVTNSERRISRQRAFLPAPGDARADWWQMAEVGKRMGYAAAFSFADGAAVFAEYAALSASENSGTRDFDIGAFADTTSELFAEMEPFLWPQPAGGAKVETRFFADGNFYTPDRRARFVPVSFRGLAQPTDAAFPFVLNTGRIRDQWHTMTRTGKTPRLTAHIAEPFVEIHPDDAAVVGVSDAALAIVSSALGHIVVRALITDRQRKGSLYVPMHWNDQSASTARVDALVAANVDAVSGQPELKGCAATIRPFAASWYGFAVTQLKPAIIAADYWAIAPTNTGWRMEVAGRDAIANLDAYALAMLAPSQSDAEILTYDDPKSGQHRFAAFVGETLIGALYLGPQPIAVSRNFAADSMDVAWPQNERRMRILAGKAGANERDRGATICACFDVGLNDIVSAIVDGKCMSVEAVGLALKAGTNCGSCRPEIGKIIHDQSRAKSS